MLLKNCSAMKIDSTNRRLTKRAGGKRGITVLLPVEQFRSLCPPTCVGSQRPPFWEISMPNRVGGRVTVSALAARCSHQL